MMHTFETLSIRFQNAFQWLCKCRKNHPPDSDIGGMKREWPNQADRIIRMFASGSYRLAVQKKVTLACGDTIAMWSSKDSIVIKVLTGILQDGLEPCLSESCYHLKGHGGLKGAVRDVMNHLPDYTFFCKTDVKSYYDSMDHVILMMKLHDYIQDQKIIGYVWQFFNRCVEWGGLYQDITRGIARGSSLSPLLGAFYLMDLDNRMKVLDVKYFRYMDDVLILAPTRWKLRKAIVVMNNTFDELRLEQHPDKTLIGRTEQGFDFLGYHFKPGGLSVAGKTIERFMEHIARLYEQGADSLRIGLYVSRWTGWVEAGIGLTDKKNKGRPQYEVLPLAFKLSVGCC
jgi:RNA-directed DNA polymerase